MVEGYKGNVRIDLYMRLYPLLWPLSKPTPIDTRETILMWLDSCFGGDLRATWNKRLSVYVGLFNINSDNDVSSYWPDSLHVCFRVCPLWSLIPHFLMSETACYTYVSSWLLASPLLFLQKCTALA